MRTLSYRSKYSIFANHSSKTLQTKRLLSCISPFMSKVTGILFVVGELMCARYLELELSGPFINSLKANYDLALACVAYMSFGLTLIDSQSSEEERTVRVGKG